MSPSTLAQGSAQPLHSIPDYSRFSTPVWPKAHTLQLSSDDYYRHRSTGSGDAVDASSAPSLKDRDGSRYSNHRPLGNSRDGTGRRAGTHGDYEDGSDTESSGSGEQTSQMAHVLALEEQGVMRTLEKQELAKNWSEDERKEIEQLLKEIEGIERTSTTTTNSDSNRLDSSDVGDLAHGGPTPSEQRTERRRMALQKLFKNKDVVISIREIKHLIHNWKKEDPQFRTTENDIKSQDWRGRKEEEEAKKKKDQAASSQQTKQAEKPKDDQQSGTGSSDKASTDQSDSSREDSSKPQGQSADDKQDTPKAKDDQSKGDSPRDKENNDSKDNGSDGSEIQDPDQHRFYSRLIEEMEMFAKLPNNPAKINDTTSIPQRSDGRALSIQVDDQFTPDSWVARSSHLLRLTGKHPMNAECNLTELFDAGLITPTKLHYVRNHGAVPQLAWETHRLEIFSDPPGLIQRRSLSMDQIANDFECIEMPVTLACDGNRRKEVNMVKKSAGFGWSAAGVSTCVWRGALVRDILIKYGLADQPDHERWYLNYEGADEPSEGRYATSIPLAHAMSFENDVMLAYGINGEPLSPDHGFPLRSIIPGYVGGRCVKWLAKLWITKKPNSSHYHIWDNRVVPSFITDKSTMEAKAFFHHPDTACNEQALQSVICKPAHGEYLVLGSNWKRKIKLEGYAYHGNGHLVQRVELSLDGGKQWKYCFRRVVDRPLRHGHKFWTWLFWEVEVDLQELANAQEIIARAWDPMKNCQPEHITWNLMGMMNNSWYRVRVTAAAHPETGEPALWFQHPVEPGAGDSGWMKPNEAEMAKEEAAKRSTDNEKEFSLDEIEKHNKENDAWIILNNKVYDVTSVLSWHPGGAAAILNYAGKATVDATSDYSSIHDDYANQQRDKLLIGKLSEDGTKTLQEDAKRAAKVAEETKTARKDFALNPFNYTAVTLKERKEVSKDTRIYTFELPQREDGSCGKLGLPIGKHVQIAFHMRNGVVMRPYTPIRPVLPKEEDGTFDLLVKSYFPLASSFKPGGTMGNYLDVLEVGEKVDIKGPTGDIEYLGNGKFKIHDEEFHFDKVNLIAGGTGLTPHWQLIHAILKGDNDQTQVSMIDCNSSFEDILLYEELRELSKDDRFDCWFTLSHPPQDRDWPYSKGHLDEGLMRDHLFQTDNKTAVGTFLCGPPGLIEKAAIPALKAMGFKDGKTMFGF